MHRRHVLRSVGGFRRPQWAQCHHLAASMLSCGADFWPGGAACGMRGQRPVKYVCVRANNTRTARPRTINNQQGSGHTKQGFRVATGAPSFEGWILGPRARATRSQTTCEGCALRAELICAKVWPSRERERAVSRARARRARRLRASGSGARGLPRAVVRGSRGRRRRAALLLYLLRVL